MRTRLYADLLGFLRAACTHASRTGQELPVLPFYVKEHAVGWLRPSFADLLRRWPHLFDVSPADPQTYAVVTVVLIAVALIAAYAPARRAAAVDPMLTLRSE